MAERTRSFWRSFCDFPLLWCFCRIFCSLFCLWVHLRGYLGRSAADFYFWFFLGGNYVTPLPGVYEKSVPKQDGAHANFIWRFLCVFLRDSSARFLRKNKAKNRTVRSRFFVFRLFSRNCATTLPGF